MAVSRLKEDAEETTADTVTKAQDVLPPVKEEEEEDNEEDLEEEEEEEGSDEDENMGVPTDEGYSWVIMACAFLSGAVCMGFQRSLSALFVDVSEEFSASTTVTALTFTFLSISISISTLLSSNFLLGRVRVQRICVVAGFFNAVTTMVISRAPNIITWLCLHAVKGIFFGAISVPPTAMIGYYFKKRRSLASSIASAGIVVASIVYPPLSTFLRAQFGLRGALLILGAIELHMVAIGLLFRPVSSYKKAYLRRRETALKTLQSSEAEIQGAQSSKPSESPQKAILERQLSTLSTQSEIFPLHRTSSLTYSKRRPKVERQRSLATGMGSGSHIESEKYGRRNGPRMYNRSISRSDSVTSGTFLGASCAGSMLDIAPMMPISDENEGESVNENTEKDTGGYEKKNSCSCSLSTFIDTSLLKLWKFRMILLFMALSSFSNFIMSYMPAIAIQAGIPKTDAAFLLTLAGCTDLVVRVFIGLIADKDIISKENMIIGSLSVIVVITQFARFYTTFALFVMFALLSGTFCGFRQNLMNAILLDYFGADGAPKALGITVMCITFTVSINHPVLGVLVDATGSFTASLHYVGVGVFLSVLTLMTHPICKRWDEENKKKAEETADDDEKDLTMRD